MIAAPRGGPRKEAAAAPPSTTATRESLTAADYNRNVLPLRRRRSAAQRLGVLDCGRPDPWHYAEVGLTDHQLDAWRCTIAHLLENGLRCAVPAEVLRALR